MKLSNLNTPARFTDDDFKDKEVNRFRMEYPNMIVFKQSYNSEAELEKDKAKWDMMGYEQRLVANEKSISLFGSNNEERYPRLKAKFTKADIKNTEIPKVYSPSDKTFNENFPNYHDDFVQALRLSESWNKPFYYLRAIEKSYDILEQLYLIEAMQNLDTGDSIIAKEVKSYARNIQEGLLKRDDDEVYPIGYYKESFFTPKEIEENHLEVPKAWFEDFKMRCYGVNTYKFNVSEKPNKALFGILDEQVYKDRSIYSDRVNEALSKEVFTNRYFIDLSYINEYGVITEEAAQNTKGISIFFLHTMIDNELATRIAIGLDPLSDTLYEFTRGKIGRRITIKDLKNDEDDFLCVYFLPMSDELYNNISSGIKEMNEKNYTPKNFVQDICNKLDIDCPVVANDKLFYVHLAHCLITLIRGEEINLLPNKPVYSYILYRGEADSYNRAKMYSKLNIYSSKDIDTSHLQEGYFRMSKLDLQVLLESNDSTTIDKTGFNRVNYKEFSDTLSRFSVE